MSTSIRISEETKRKLKAVKRTDETFDELLTRLAVDRSELPLPYSLLEDGGLAPEIS
ncbi:antitoxin VapB family protein [Salinarchaeum sp. IM2453]|uniref:antitoxin VapB family protein n=1 Tax=Salinarchaeum sp. IM2453 TaxID=2862870 RepID=UPI001C83F2B6|nr:antitoxin VapB family protein [Salinarchaeum sp. IM2453]QZA89838.1 antitoxin VapB family protein [Salinarchaeum sp. IM2453]